MSSTAPRWSPVFSWIWRALRSSSSTRFMSLSEPASERFASATFSCSGP
jgi:hypothetical protein